jgi:hypothetical protein
MQPYGNGQPSKTQKLPKKHEKTRKNAKTTLAENHQKRAFFLSILKGRFERDGEGLLSIHPKIAIFDIF